MDPTDKPNRNRIESESGKVSKGETSIFLWYSLEIFVMMTWEVSGIRLRRFLIIVLSSTYCLPGTILAFYGYTNKMNYIIS